MDFDVNALTKSIEWQEGKEVVLLTPCYRYNVIILCTSQGRRKAQFANGECSYFSYIQIIDAGKWIQKCISIAPVLPDGRLIMVVEQRPPQFAFGNRPGHLKLHDKTIDLNEFGPYSSLEFPSGGVDPNEGITAGFLRELQEETGVGNQTATLYLRQHPWYPAGADISIQQFLGVVELRNPCCQDRVENDGGLFVLALHPSEIACNIHSGVISSAAAALSAWSFYKEVVEGWQCPDTLIRLVREGYIRTEEVKISKN